MLLLILLNYNKRNLYFDFKVDETLMFVGEIPQK